MIFRGAVNDAKNGIKIEKSGIRELPIHLARVVDRRPGDAGTSDLYARDKPVQG